MSLQFRTIIAEKSLQSLLLALLPSSAMITLSVTLSKISTDLQ